MDIHEAEDPRPGPPPHLPREFISAAIAAVVVLAIPFMWPPLPIPAI